MRLALTIAGWALLLVALIGAAGARSGNARTTAIACGATLTASAVLAADLDCSSSGGTAITLGAANIKLDLGGHHLAVNAGQIGVASSFSGDTVTNGSIDGSATGVEILHTFGDTVSKLTLKDDFIDLESTGQVTVASNTISWDGLGNPAGISSEYGSKNVITGNTIGEGGISLSHESKDAISKNTVTSSVADGTYNYYERASNGDVYTANVSSGNADGFNISEGGNGVVTLIGNVESGAGDDGFALSGNYAASTPSAHSSYAKNTATGDGQANFESSGDIDSAWSGNVATGSLYGFDLDHPQGYAMSGNKASHDNNADFNLMDDAAIEQPATFTSNNASTSHFGFKSQYFLVIGSGNTVTANTTDCDNTSCPKGGTTS
jgi:hypothetical protein